MKPRRERAFKSDPRKLAKRLDRIERQAARHLDTQMMQARTAVVFLVLAVGAAGQRTQRPERVSLEGTWIVTSRSLNGQTSDTGGAEIAITIAGDTYEQRVDGNVDERGTITVDPTANPMTIDFIITEGMAKDTTQRGIVAITGDAVKFCLNTPGATVRPADFTPRADYMLIFAKKR